jgi:phosphatidylglycerol lysyltransferase
MPGVHRAWFKWRYGPLPGLCIFLLSLWGLHQALVHTPLSEVVRALHAIDAVHVSWALALTVVSFIAFAAYDVLAFRYVGQPLPNRHLAFGTFIGSLFRSHSGFGGSLRDRLFTDWRISGWDASRMLLFCTLTYWLGLFSLGGVVLSLGTSPLPVLETLRPAGIVMIVATFVYVLLTASKRVPRALLRWDLALPSMPVALGQIGLAVVDWLAMGGALYVLLPPSLFLRFSDVLCVFLVCRTVSVLSPVPGGAGIFEWMFIYLLAPCAPVAPLFAAALAFRFVTQLLPIWGAALLLGVGERGQRFPAHLQRLWRSGSRLSVLVPHVLALATFLAGAVLLYSGAIPELTGRLAVLSAWVSLPLLEASHFLASLTGAALLILARGIQRRLDSAFWLTAACLVAGMVFSLLKGFDYEEALALSCLLLALVFARKHFWRKGSLLSGGSRSGWVAAALATAVSAGWIVVFAFKNVAYSDQIWWRFLLQGSVPRSLRATAGALCLVLLYTVATLLRSARPPLALPGPAALETAASIAGHSKRVSAYRVLSGDKMVLFNPQNTAFVMYGIRGESWIVLGDPVGPEDEMADLVWRLHEMCDQYAGRLVFYQVEERYLALYVDLGFNLYRLGEEARVPLATFSLDGGDRKGLRHTYHRAARANLAFDVLPAGAVDAFLPELKAVSDAWLKEKHTREKGFSVGGFDADYLRRFPLVVVRQEGRIVAFGNLLCGADKEELSMDLMRLLPDAPYGVMEFLFIELMLWGRGQGYAWFNLGMAPLSDEHGHASVQLWDRFGALVFNFGEYFYNFRGVRDFKEQFHPRWSPRYIAIGSGLMLPRALADIAALIAGGYRGLLVK